MTGAFVAIVGPSGAGKDTLIDYVRERLTDETGFGFVRRVVTRAADPAAEDHDSLSEAQFEALERSGGLALHWRAHGLRYGLPRAVDRDIAAGRVIIANISRQVIPTIAARYDKVVVVMVSARPEIIAERLLSRGREDAEAIRLRLARQPDPISDTVETIEIDNSGAVDVAGERLLAVLKELAMGVGA